MSFKATLFIFDKQYPLIDAKHSLKQHVDISGRPTSRVLGGKLELQFVPTSDDTALLEAMISPYQMVKGYIRVYKRDGMSKDFDIEFANAFVILLTYTFNAENSESFIMETHISPQIQRSRDTIFELSANPSNPFTKEQVPVTEREVPQTAISRIAWINADDQEEDITEISYTQKASLIAEIQNPEGGTATITIEKEDGSEFENGKKQLSFTESVTEEGTVEISPLEIKEQWEEFKTADIDKLVAKVAYNGASKKSAALQIVPKPQLVANFRPATGWNGEKYGFDWIRIGDSGLTGDTVADAYKNIIGHHYITPPGSVQRKATDGEIASGQATFVSEQTEFDAYKKDFSPVTIPWKLDAKGNPEEYYTPWLSILRIPDTHPDYDPTHPYPIIDLVLHTEVKNPAHRIKVKYDNTYYEITAPGATVETNGTVDHLILPAATNVAGTKQLNLTIKNIKTYKKDQTIEVLSEEKQSNGTIVENSVGKMIANANAKKQRKKTKILLVNVKTDLSGTGNNSTIGLDVANRKPIKDMLKRFLNQALIIPEYDIEDLDLKTDTAFNNKYAPGGTFSPSVVHAELDQSFFFDDAANPTVENSAKSKYRDYFRIYFIGEGCATSSYGAAAGIVADTCIVYCKGLTDTTAAHELYHAMGLYHSFSNLGTYTYSYGKTDCIMDYSDIATPAIPVIQFYKWQWEVLRNNPKIKKE